MIDYALAFGIYRETFNLDTEVYERGQTPRRSKTSFTVLSSLVFFFFVVVVGTTTSF